MEIAVQHVADIQKEMTNMFHMTPEGQAKFEALENQVEALKPGTESLASAETGSGSHDVVEGADNTVDKNDVIEEDGSLSVIPFIQSNFNNFSCRIRLSRHAYGSSRR